MSDDELIAREQEYIQRLRRQSSNTIWPVLTMVLGLTLAGWGSISQWVTDPWGRLIEFHDVTEILERDRPVEAQEQSREIVRVVQTWMTIAQSRGFSNGLWFAAGVALLASGWVWRDIQRRNRLLLACYDRLLELETRQRDAES